MAGVECADMVDDSEEDVLVVRLGQLQLLRHRPADVPLAGDEWSHIDDLRKIHSAQSSSFNFYYKTVSSPKPII